MSDRSNLMSRRKMLKLLGVGASASLLAVSSAGTVAAAVLPPVAPAAPRSLVSDLIVRQTITVPAPEKKTVKIAHSTLETSQLAYACARELGFFKAYGFDDVELLFAEGDGKTLQALVSGAVDMTAQGVSVTISSQATDVPLTTIAMSATTLTDALVTSADVKSADDLRGKAIAISTFGSTAHAAAVLCLQTLNLTQDDVTLTQVGGQATRIAALKGGSVQGAVVDVALEEEMKSQGFNILTRLPDSPLEFGRNGANVRREWTTQYPNTVLALTAAIVEGQNAIWTRTEDATAAFAKWGQKSDMAGARNEVEQFKKYGNRDMLWTKEGWILARDVLATTNAEIADIDVAQAYTMEYLDKLQSMGLQQALGITVRPH